MHSNFSLFLLPNLPKSIRHGGSRRIIQLHNSSLPTLVYKRNPKMIIFENRKKGRSIVTCWRRAGYPRKKRMKQSKRTTTSTDPARTGAGSNIELHRLNSARQKHNPTKIRHPTKLLSIYLAVPK